MEEVKYEGENQENRRDGERGKWWVLFFILVFPVSLSRAGELEFNEFKQKYGDEWIGEFENDRPLFIYGGRFTDPKEKYLKEFNPSWKSGYVPPGRSYEAKELIFPVEGFKLAVDDFRFIPSYISPNGDGKNDACEINI